MEQIQTKDQTMSSTEDRNEEYGISPTYYSSGKVIHTHHSNQNVGSPVYGDTSRVFFTHQSSCSCRGSGVGCDCTKTCSC